MVPYTSYIASSFKSFMCGVLKFCGPVACNLISSSYIRGWYLSGFCSRIAGIVVCIESDSYSSIYAMFLLGIINAMMNLKQFGPLALICVETNWPGS